MMRWREEQLISVEGNASKLDYEEARRRKVAADALLAEQKAAMRAGELIPKEDFVVAMQTVFAHCRARLLAIPAKLAPTIYHCESVPAAKEKITEVIRDALQELSETRVVSTTTDPKRRAH